MNNEIEIEGIKNQFKELTGLMNDHKINAAYNPLEHRNIKTTQCFANGVAFQAIR